MPATALQSAPPARRTASPSLLQRWVGPFVDPATLDFWLAHLNPSWSWNRPLARIVDRRVEAQDMVTLVLAPNRHCSDWQPGQHVNVSAEVNGRRTTRSYSISSMPNRRGHLSITVKRVEGGKLSTHLCQHAQVGEVVELGHAFGDMTLPQPPALPQGHWMFLAAGSGITPLISLTRALAERGMPVRLSLLLWAPTRAALPFVPELRALALRHPGFKVRFALTQEAATQSDELGGRLQSRDWAELVRESGLPGSVQQVMACGPSGFVQAARELCEPNAHHFQAEAFTPAPVNRPDTEEKTVKVHLRHSGRDLQVSTHQSLLEALEAQGLSPAHGCRMGVCHTCVCTKVEGTVCHTERHADLDTEPDTAVRLCVSRACSDLTLDL